MLTRLSEVWTLYKEVQTYYSQGLIPEDDVTLMFSDDNWGNIQRLPLSNETSRSGGIGVSSRCNFRQRMELDADAASSYTSTRSTWESRCHINGPTQIICPRYTKTYIMPMREEWTRSWS